MTVHRTMLVLRLLALALLLAGVGAGPLGAVTAPAVLADEGEDESGGGGDDGDKDKDEGRDEGRDENKDDDKDEGNGSEGRVEQAAAYRVDVECGYDEAADETTCAFAGVAPPEAKDVSHVDLPASEVCAEVLGGEHEYVDPDPNTRVVGYKSRGSEGTFSLVMTGEVTTGGTATYWFKTGDGVFPATGPGLVCSGAAAQQASGGADKPEVTAEAEVQVTVELRPLPTDEAAASASGSILVQVYACGATPADPAAFDWYGACEPGVVGIPFALTAKEGTRLVDAGDGATAAAGVLRFEALAPGTYHLAAINAVWCHAESDGVDEQGDLVVEAGRRVTVWIFFCDEGAAT